jgi:hypothetical protein
MGERQGRPPTPLIHPSNDNIMERRQMHIILIIIQKEESVKAVTAGAPDPFYPPV